MVNEDSRTTIIDGLIFPEGLRWRDDELWFCDIEEHEVITADAAGTVRGRLEFPGEYPIGLAWLPDGKLVVGGRFERLLTARDGEIRVLHDIEVDGVTDSWSNDTVVDATGRIYVSSFGKAYDLVDHESNVQKLKGAGRIVLVDRDGSTRTVAGGLSMPNTMQITPDGETLICCDSFAHRVVKYGIEPDGSLGPEELFAQFNDMTDGSTLDRDGGLWVALPHVKQARRVLDGGEVTDVIEFEDDVFDVALGGPDGTTLFASTSNLAATTPPADGSKRARPGRIIRIEVDVPAA
ncbi:SMP-30/gluconolactonase/LRE family protein [Rhodococcus wratislaviensis]|uniref:Putative lactone hydrolase n=1 Tax=Rhodococcus wratislaviensis NBRC 100605 TaxID=1219028 RepID=X0Q990_RHOWR|nr:SMP-30/gluconolactonase/LRE family protein [Rhodococcus wratislaviensis]GAF48137.1 putative lactone hydrolase [Rhodococcus wratislaviensis NBRC 100605]